MGHNPDLRLVLLKMTLFLALVVYCGPPGGKKKKDDAGIRTT